MTLLPRMPGGALKGLSCSPQRAQGWRALSQPRRAESQNGSAASGRPGGGGRRSGVRVSATGSAVERAGNSRVRSTVLPAREPSRRPTTGRSFDSARSIGPQSGALTTAGRRKVPSSSQAAGRTVVEVTLGSKGKMRRSEPGAVGAAARSKRVRLSEPILSSGIFDSRSVTTRSSSFVVSMRHSRRAGPASSVRKTMFESLPWRRSTTLASCQALAGALPLERPSDATARY